MTLAEVFDLRPFHAAGLWRAALMEGMGENSGIRLMAQTDICVWGAYFMTGTLMIVWLTIYANISPATIPDGPTERWGTFDNAAFVGPLVGGVLNFLYLTLFTFCFGAVSGAHLNPTITIATLFARLCSFPRAVLYIAFQTGGGALGGLMARASYGTRDFKVGGCWIYTDVVPVGDAFAVELMTCTILLFFAFGVGLDPRQRQIVGPTLGPFLVGLSLAGLSFGTGYSRYGYGGASLNPARCFGTFVGSRFPGHHWIHWYVPSDRLGPHPASLDLCYHVRGRFSLTDARVADIVACGVHAVFYHLVPPWEAKLK
jgi:glycerol uptake facilitator-like aquaporin